MIFKMNLYLLLVTLTLVNAGVVPDTECDGVIIDGKYYDKEILKTGLDASELVVDYNSNKIHFKFLVDRRTQYPQCALLDLDSKEFKFIEFHHPNGISQTVDPNTHNVFIGTNDGIYKYDNKNHKTELYAAKDKDIWRVFFKDVLYFTEYPFEVMNTYIDGNIAKFKDLDGSKIEDFVIDGEDVMFYYNTTGFYGQKKGGKDAVLYSDKMVMRALTVDAQGNAYMCTNNAVYKINKNNTSLDKLMDLRYCFGLAFDNNNNMIYSDAESLIRFKINKDKKC